MISNYFGVRHPPQGDKPKKLLDLHPSSIPFASMNLILLVNKSINQLSFVRACVRAILENTLVVNSFL